jgi:tripartite-type tricarboxylate transporter receptor subunit TctC
MKATKIAAPAAATRLWIWRHWFNLWCLPILLGMMLGSAAAQGLSSRAITIIVPYSPGTGPDVMARNIGEELQKRWNQAVVIDNKAGATGISGSRPR